MKLYEVNVKYYVLAEDEDGATMMPSGFDLSACDVDVWEAESLDVAWKDALPFGGDGKKTCGQIMEEQQAEQQASSTPATGEQGQLEG